MSYMQKKLIESVQQDRQCEAEVARLSNPARFSRIARHRLLVLPPVLTDIVRQLQLMKGADSE